MKTPKRVQRVIDALSSGQTLCMQMRKSDTGDDLVFWLEPSGRSVGVATARKAEDLGVIEGNKDGLFGESQTWRLSDDPQ